MLAQGVEQAGAGVEVKRSRLPIYGDGRLQARLPSAGRRLDRRRLCSKVRSVLAGGEGFHRERMQGTCQLLGQCPVDHPLPRHLWGALEGLGLNDDVKMALAGGAGPRMSRVAIGVVYDFGRVGENASVSLC